MGWKTQSGATRTSCSFSSYHCAALLSFWLGTCIFSLPDPVSPGYCISGTVCQDNRWALLPGLKAWALCALNLWCYCCLHNHLAWCQRMHLLLAQDLCFMERALDILFFMQLCWHLLRWTNFFAFSRKESAYCLAGRAVDLAVGFIVDLRVAQITDPGWSSTTPGVPFGRLLGNW